MRKLSLWLLLSLLINGTGCKPDPGIDRFTLVTRHNIENSVIDSLNSLSVGNGEFAFTVDITGLQTFPEFYSKGISLGTMSDWGWHTWPNPRNFRLEDNYKTYYVHGKPVNYVHQFSASEDSLKAEASTWLRTNPHRIHLGMIGLYMTNKDGTETGVNDINNPVQKLNLWDGEIDSRFQVEGIPVHVTTICHPDKDMISVRISSGLIAEKRFCLKIHFPLGVSSPGGYDFNEPERHNTRVLANGNSETLFEREQVLCESPAQKF